MDLCLGVPHKLAAYLPNIASISSIHKHTNISVVDVLVVSELFTLVYYDFHNTWLSLIVPRHVRKA